MNKKTFPLEDVLTFTSGYTISRVNISDYTCCLFQIAWHVTGEEFDELQLSYRVAEIREAIFKQHPTLKELGTPEPLGGWTSLSRHMTDGEQARLDYIDTLHKLYGTKEIELIQGT